MTASMLLLQNRPKKKIFDWHVWRWQYRGTGLKRSVGLQHIVCVSLHHTQSQRSLFFLHYICITCHSSHLQYKHEYFQYIMYIRDNHSMQHINWPLFRFPSNTNRLPPPLFVCYLGNMCGNDGLLPSFELWFCRSVGTRKAIVSAFLQMLHGWRSTYSSQLVACALVSVFSFVHYKLTSVPTWPYSCVTQMWLLDLIIVNHDQLSLNEPHYFSQASQK